MGLASKLIKISWGLAMLAGLASQARAGTFGICLLPGLIGTGGSSSAEYATVNVGGCGIGFSSSLTPGAVLSPGPLGPGLTTATLGINQPMSAGGVDTGTVSAISGASLDQGLLRVYGDSEGFLGSCGGSCLTTGGRTFPEALLEDTLHFTITDAASSAIVTFRAHLDGIAALGSGATGAGYSVTETWGLGGGGCWESLGGGDGNGFGPCLSGNGGYISSSFSNQTATGFDFTGTFSVTNGQSSIFFATLQEDCAGGALCDFSNTASFSLSLPSDVTFASDSGVLFTQQQSDAPEPGTLGLAGVVVVLLGVLRRRIGRSAAGWTLP